MEFFYPYVTNEKDCRACEDCVNSCPVGAISFDNTKEWHVDKEKCRNYQKKIQDTCINCVQYCRRNVIQLKEEV